MISELQITVICSSTATIVRVMYEFLGQMLQGLSVGSCCSLVYPPGLF